MDELLKTGYEEENSGGCGVSAMDCSFDNGSVESVFFNNSFNRNNFHDNIFDDNIFNNNNLLNNISNNNPLNNNLLNNNLLNNYPLNNSIDFFKTSTPVKKKPLIITEPLKVLKIKRMADDFYSTHLTSYGDMIVYVSEDNKVNVIDHHEFFTKKMDLNIQSVITSIHLLSSDTLLIGTSTGQLITHNFIKNTQTKITPHKSRIGIIKNKNNLIVTGSRDRSIKMFDGRMGVVCCIERHSQEVCGIAFNEDGGVVASGGNDNKVFVVDLRMGGRVYGRVGVKNFKSTSGNLLNHNLSNNPSDNFSNNLLNNNSLSNNPLIRNPIPFSNDTLTNYIKIKAHKAAVKALHFDGKYKLYTCGGSADKTLRIWDISTTNFKKESFNKENLLVKEKVFNSQITSIRIKDDYVITSHGYSQNDIRIMRKGSLIEERVLRYHGQRVLQFVVVGGCVGSVGGEEMAFWKVGGGDEEMR